MASTDYAKGCVGCVDYAVNNHSCDYLFHNGHCRPCKVNGAGCECYSAEVRPEGTEESRRTWDTEEARRLLADAVPLYEAAERIGASINSMQVWIKGGMIANRSAKPAAPPARGAKAAGKRGKRGVWNEETYRKLYAEGLTDPEAAERMGLNTQTVWMHRKRLGLPANGTKKN